jgi:hypothetical protein
MLKTHSIPQLMALQEQGWVHPNDAPGSDWKEGWQKEADAEGFTYQAPHFDPAKHLISPSEGDTYVAGTVPEIPKT